MEKGEPGHREAKWVSVVGAKPRRAVGPSARDVEEPQVEEPQVEEPQVEEPQVEELQVAESGVRARRGRTEARALREEASRPRRRPARLRRGLGPGVSVALGVLALVGTVSGIGFGLAWSNLDSQNQQRQAVKSAASTFLLDLTNFKPSTVDADFAALESWAAGDSLFAKQAAETFNSSIRQALIQANAVYQGEIRDIYVESLKGPQAEVYAVMDTTYENSKNSSPTTDTLRVTLDMTDRPAGWRVSAVTVENPSGISGSGSGAP